LQVDFVSYEQPEMEAMTKRRRSIRFNPAIAPARGLASASYPTTGDTTTDWGHFKDLNFV